MYIIASLTTIPSRINLILPTIESIFKQTIPVRRVDINIPYFCKRTNEEYKIPTWLVELEQNSKGTKCEVFIYRTEDYGALTKVVPTLIRHRNINDAYVWSVDDDFIYPQNMLAVLYREYIPNNNYILCHSIGTWKKDENNNCIGYRSKRTEGFGNFFEGFCTVLYPPRNIEEDFEKYIIKASETLDNRNSDDVILSNYFNLKGVKIYNVAYPYDKDRMFISSCSSEYGHKNDALHKQGGGNTERYLRVYNWLTEQNLNSWVNNIII